MSVSESRPFSRIPRRQIGEIKCLLEEQTPDLSPNYEPRSEGRWDDGPQPLRPDESLKICRTTWNYRPLPTGPVWMSTGHI